MPAPPRVFFRKGEHMLVLGPLGCYEVGQRVELPDGIVYVGSIDTDGAAVAWREEYLDAQAAEYKVPRERFLETLKGARTGFTAGFANERQHEQMAAQCVANRARYGLDEEALAA